MRASIVVNIESGQFILFVGALISAIGTLAGLVHKGDLDRIKDRDTIIAKLEATNARLQGEADKMTAAKNDEVLEWRKRALAAMERTAS
jgi:hypothetical protein